MPRSSFWYRMVSVKFLLASIVLLQTCLLSWSAYVHSPTWDEVGHLAAGISHWKTGRFDLYAVNPPLTRVIAAAPVVLLDEPKMDWSVYRNKASFRSEVYLGRRMIELNGTSIYRRFFLARMSLVPIALVGTWLCFAFARRIFGVHAGLLSASLWAFSPSVLAYGSVVTPDLSSTVVVLAVAYGFLQWLELRNWPSTGLLSLVTGTAMLIKSVWIFLPCALLAGWIIYEVWGRSKRGTSFPERRNLAMSMPWRTSLLQFGVVVIGALFLVNCFYGFQGSFQTLGQYDFVSTTLSGIEPCIDCGEAKTGNRFAANWTARLPVPLPSSYLAGIDVQRSDFEKGISDPAWKSYLFGWQQGGWWYFYFVGLFFKEPIALWLLFSLATVVVFLIPPDYQQRKWLFALAVPSFMLLFLISINTGLNRYVRYALPLLPLVFIWTSQVAKLIEPSLQLVSKMLRRVSGPKTNAMPFPSTMASKGWQVVSALVGITWLSFIAASVWQGPHWLSFFNIAAGGPSGGYHVLCDSNVDWGQELPQLQHWLDDHPEAKQSLFLAYFGSYDPASFGIDYTLPTAISSGHPQEIRSKLSALSEGWYVISKNFLAGHRMPVPDGNQRLLFDQIEDNAFTYFLALEPVGKIGNSMLVFHVDETCKELLANFLLDAPAHTSASLASNK